MPSIKVNKKIYVPMTDTILTIDNIGKLPPFETYRGKQKEPSIWKREQADMFAQRI